MSWLLIILLVFAFLILTLTCVVVVAWAAQGTPAIVLQNKTFPAVKTSAAPPKEDHRKQFSLALVTPSLDPVVARSQALPPGTLQKPISQLITGKEGPVSEPAAVHEPTTVVVENDVRVPIKEQLATDYWDTATKERNNLGFDIQLLDERICSHSSTVILPVSVQQKRSDDAVVQPKTIQWILHRWNNSFVWQSGVEQFDATTLTFHIPTTISCDSLRNEREPWRLRMYLLSTMNEEDIHHYSVLLGELWFRHPSRLVERSRAS